MHFSLIVSALVGFAFSEPILPRTCPNVAVIKNGGFETNSISPWSVTGFIGASTYALTSPGSTNNGGQYAFTAILYPGPYSNGASGVTLSQTMHTCAGKNYSILADYKFDQSVNNYCSIAIKYPFKTTQGSVTTGSNIGPAGVWQTTGSTFQAVSSADVFYVVFTCSNGANDKISVDNVKIVPFSGNAF